MALTAIDSEGTRFYGPNYSDPKTEIVCKGQLLHPITLTPVTCVRRGTKSTGKQVRAHFRLSDTDCLWPDDVILDDEYMRAGRLNESIEHLTTKILVMEEWGINISSAWDVNLATTEYRIWMPNHERYRIADVALITVSTSLVVEVQYSPITVQSLRDRSDDYIRAGFDIQWIFGPANHKDVLRDWHEDYLKSPAIYAEVFA
jgi:hypothetical protein